MLPGFINQRVLVEVKRICNVGKDQLGYFGLGSGPAHIGGCRMGAFIGPFPLSLGAVGFVNQEARALGSLYEAGLLKRVSPEKTTAPPSLSIRQPTAPGM